MAEDDKELKDQRVVTMMSPSELEAIDDWMFKNRIRSRGEAIRRLCQVGIDFDRRVEALFEVALRGALKVNDRGSQLTSVGKSAEQHDLYVMALETAVDGVHSLMEVAARLGSLKSSNALLKSPEGFLEVSSRAQELLNRLENPDLSPAERMTAVATFMKSAGVSPFTRSEAASNADAPEQDGNDK